MSNYSAEPIDLSRCLSPVRLISGLPSMLGACVRQGLFPAIIGASIAAILYGLLPAVGIEQAVQALSFKKLFVMCFAVAGAVGFWIFLDFIKQRPQWLLYAALIGLPILTWLSNMTLNNGVNIYKNVWLMGGICAPVVYMMWPHLGRIWKQLPFYKYFVVYLLVAGYFYVFNNHLVFDQRFTGGSQPMSFHAFFTSIYHFLTITLVGCAVMLEKRPKQTFDAINFIVLWVTIIYAVISLVTYPFKIFTEFLEGVERTRFIFLFTNEYSFYMQFLITYLLGVYFYHFEVREKDTVSRLPWQVTYPVAIVLGALAMATSFTKTSIGVFALIAALILLGNAARVVKQRALMFALGSLPIVLIVGAVIFQITSGTDLMAGIEARMNNTDSMTWREHAWDNLLSDMPLSTWFTGHGFTASSERMQLFEKFIDMNDSTANAVQVLAVHNSYLSQTYDFGLLGVVIMMGLAWMSLQVLWRLIWRQSGSPALNALDTLLFAMMLTYLILCAVNNTFDMMQLPFWILLSVLYFAHHQTKLQARAALAIPQSSALNQDDSNDSSFLPPLKD